MSELCVPGCKYRQLYEGSQTSLADMAAKQAQSVLDHQRLRSTVATVLKRYFPREYQQAERTLGHRLDRADDEVLAAYLDGLLNARQLGGGLDALRAALVQAGYPIDGDDVDAWVDVIRTSKRGTRHPEEPTANPGTANPVANPASPVPVAGIWGPATGAGEDEPPEAPVPQPVETPALDPLDELLADLGATPASTAGSAVPTTAVADVPVDPLDELADLFASTPEPEPQPAPHPEPQPAPQPDVATATPEPAAGMTDPAETPDSLGALFGDPVPAPATPSPAAPADPDGLDGLGALFGDPPAASDAPTGLGALFGDPEPSGPGPTGPDPSTSADRAQAVPLPLRPELVPPAKRTGKRPVRTRAVRADVPETTAANALDERTRTALLAAVAIPRPVFVLDLAQITGARETVEDWETEMRDLKMDSPVRFIGGKARHRLRGSLVIPHGALRDASTEFTSSWWAECLERYRGAKLYELAVLLHRVGADVIASEFDDENVVLFRLNERRGLAGMVVCLDGEFGEGSPTRDALVRRVGQLTKERLSLIAVLAVNHEWEAPVTQILTEAARTEGWSLNAPVVYANSWEWADDAGSTAKLVLGG